MMPPSKDANDDGWIHGDQLILPRQSLSPDEIGTFLEFLFAEIARKPKRLKLRETAGVARYLKAVAFEAPPSLERDTVEGLAEVIWLTMLDTGQIEIAQRDGVIHFLRKHADTYLASWGVERIVEFVHSLPEPSRHTEFFRPPKLLGKQRSAGGQGPARLQDDLTERIYVAYYALRRTRIRNARRLIAAVLNQHGFQTSARSATVRTWSSAEVIERVQQFEARIVRRHRLSRGDDRAKEIDRLRNMRVDSWIHGFHSASTVGSDSGRPADQH
jgi:hypothetical protein